MKIYARADQNVAYIEGVTELFTGAGVATRDGDNISIVHAPLGQYQLRNMPYTQIQDGNGNGFPDAASCLVYLQQIFKVQLNAFVLFTQSPASDTWVINHNLGYYPTVVVFSDAGVQVECTIVQVSVNQVRLEFSVAFAGTARLF